MKKRTMRVMIALAMIAAFLPHSVNAEEIELQEDEEPVIEVKEEEREQVSFDEEIEEEPIEEETVNALEEEGGYEILPMKHGSIEVDAIRMFGEDLYAIWVTPEDGFRVVSISAKDTQGNDCITEMITENVCYAKRSEEYLYITAECDGAFPYEVTAELNYDIPVSITENGVPVTRARAGHMIRVEFDPDDTYVIQTVQVKDTCGHLYEPDEVADNVYEFEMSTGDTTIAADIQLVIPYVDENGNEYIASGVKDLAMNKTHKLSSGWYCLTKTIGIWERIEIDEDVNLILMDGVTLYAQGGVHNGGSSCLSIWGQKEGTGKLYCERPHENYQAALGGNNEENGGRLDVHGGNIEVEKTGDYAASIGGGYIGDGGVILIRAGNVVVHGTETCGGAGIGGGKYGRGGEIRIYGGTVVSSGNYDDVYSGAGIGGGDSRDGGDIRIYGGNVTAVGGSGTRTHAAAGIGGGNDGDGGYIAVYGGKIVATGGMGKSLGVGAGIGGGDNGDGGDIRFFGGDTKAFSPFSWGFFLDQQGAGIGGGDWGNGGDIKVMGGRVEGHGFHAFGCGMNADKIGKLELGDNIWAGERDNIFPYEERYEKARIPEVYLFECLD